MGEEKGVDELVKAFANVHKRYPETYLFIAGLEPIEISYLENMCVNLGLRKESYKFVPLVQKNFALYTSVLDLAVMNYPNNEHYRMYMSPTKLFAYMGSSKLIVTSDLPSIREIVDERAVLFMKSGDQSSLETVLIKAIVLNENESREMSKSAFKKVQEFTWTLRTKRILEILHQDGSLRKT